MEALLIVAGIGVLALSIPLMRALVNLVLRTHTPTTNYTDDDAQDVP
jgi:hypothetical protein